MGKQKTLIKAIPERYTVLEHDGGYIVYDKQTPSQRANAHYMGKFYLSSDGKKYSYNGDYYDDYRDMFYAMEKYNLTLPFDSEIYNPIYRKNYMIEIALHDYLKSLGFEYPTYNNNNTYILKDPFGESICVITFEVESDTTKGIVSRRIRSNNPANDRWVESPFIDLDSAVAACNSIVVSYCACINARTVEIMEKATKSRGALMLEKTFDYKTLKTYVEDSKQKTIEYLEAELKRLKGE